MSNGFDTDAPITAQNAKRCVAAGYVAAGRYLKNLTLAEIAACGQAGLKLWLIDEGTGSQAVFARGASGGQTDGTAAKSRAAALGAPSGAVIYFAVDFDTQQSDVANIQAYYPAYKAAVAPYRAGMYADGLVASQVPTDVGAYLPGAMGWAGSEAYLKSGKVALVQGLPTAFFGMDADPVDIRDESVLWDTRTPAPPVLNPMPALKVAQAYLNTLGAGLVVDGVWGPHTDAAFAKYYG
jgi:hypothetical protein